jgi:hypothetical protein
MILKNIKKKNKFFYKIFLLPLYHKFKIYEKLIRIKCKIYKDW